MHYHRFKGHCYYNYMPNIQFHFLFFHSGSILLRSPFIPRSGHVFLSVDFQHIEFRIFAHLAQDVALLQLFHKPGDIFLNLAQMW